MALEIRPLSDALGAEVVGLDLTKPLCEGDAAAVKEAFLDRHLLCFRTEPLSRRTSCAPRASSASRNCNCCAIAATARYPKSRCWKAPTSARRTNRTT